MVDHSLEIEKTKAGDSLKSRYLYKTLGNAVNMASGIVVQMVVPRALGALQYGNFSFLTDFFIQFLAFFNMGSSIGFYTKLSKRPKESRLVTFYLMYIALAIAIGFLTIGIVSGFGFQGKLWPGQYLPYVSAALIFAGLMYLTTTFNDVVDAHGLTVGFEKTRFLQKTGTVVFILVLFQQQMLTMSSLFIFNYFFFLLAIFFSLYILRRGGFPVRFERLGSSQVRAYGREFYTYCKPLAVLGLIGLGVGLFDRWFLQVAGGGIEQGFYSLSFKIGALCFIFSGAMTQLITREFSIAFEKRDLGEMARLFRRHIPLLYGITAAIACFILVNADKVAVIMGGKEFSSAVIPVAIMSLYPIHQTFGQLSSSVFFASDQIRLYSSVAAVFLILGLPATWFLVASPGQHGLGLGATGLAIKMVAFNIINNNVLLYFNTRFLRLPFGWYICHQLISVAAFILVAWAVTFGMDHWFSNVGVLGRFLGAGCGYLAIVVGAVYVFPGLLGLGRQDIVAITNRITGHQGGQNAG